jgi:hypothetical protein
MFDGTSFYTFVVKMKRKNKHDNRIDTYLYIHIYTYTCIYTCIYIYIEVVRPRHPIDTSFYVIHLWHFFTYQIKIMNSLGASASINQKSIYIHIYVYIYICKHNMSNFDITSYRSWIHVCMYACICVCVCICKHSMSDFDTS